MINYNKLVRDKMIQIIKKNNEIANIHIADEEEYGLRLNDKLIEESREFIEDGTKEEIADILEVIKSICKYKGFDENEIEKIRLEKKKNRGGFDDRIILESVD